MDEQKKPMSQEDREAWLSMAGEDFLPWLQQEVGIAMAKLGFRDFTARLSELEKTGVGWQTCLEALEHMALAINNVSSSVQGLAECQAQTELAVAAMVKHISQAQKIGEAPATALEPEEVKPAAPVLSPKLQRLYDYIVKHQGKTQSELGYILKHSKTTLSEMLSELSKMGLVTYDKAKTPNGGITLCYYPVDGRKEVPARADSTFLSKVIEACRKYPWQTAGELVDKVDWGDKAPTVRIMSATLSHAVGRGMLRSYRESGDLARFAIPEAPLPMAHTDQLYKDVHGGQRAAPPAPVAPPVAHVRRAHSLHEQLVLKVLSTVSRPTSVPEITNRINLDFGTEVLNNSVNSVCIRLEKQGLLISHPLYPGSSRRRYMMAGQATST